MFKFIENVPPCREKYLLGVVDYIFLFRNFIFSIKAGSPRRPDQLTLRPCVSSETACTVMPVLHVTPSLKKSVVIGGCERGWTKVSAIVFWRRFLGLLGDISCITSASAMTGVLTYLLSLARTLLKIDAYQALVVDDDGKPNPPVDRPPLDFILPLLFKVSII